MRLLKCILLVVAALAVVAGHALSDRGGEPVSRTRAFAIDGRSFHVEDPAVDTFSVVKRELASRGIENLSALDNLASAISSRFIEPLREEHAEKGAVPLPGGFEPEHVLRLETGSGPIEIAFGRVACGEKQLLDRLRSSGWECRDTDAQGAPGAVAQLTKGMETSVVLLEKNERRFLAIRRAAR